MEKQKIARGIKCILFALFLGYITSLFLPIKEVCICQNEFCITKTYNFFGNADDKNFNILNKNVKIEREVQVRAYRSSYHLLPIFHSGYYFYDNVEKDYSMLVNYQNELENSSFDNNMNLSIVKINHPIPAGFLLIWAIGFCLYFLYQNKYILFFVQIPALIDIAYRLYIIYFMN